MEATIEDRADRVLAAAEQLLAVAPDWVTFFRAILGTDGEAARQFPSREERRAFERTAAYLNISRMLVRLRERRKDRPCPDPTRVITVRLPRSLHESLVQEAHDRQTSMNRLAVAKLLVPLAGQEAAEPAGV